MAIDIIRIVFPGCRVEWERTPRVSKPIMTVEETTSGEEVATFVQRDMSDDYRGPGVDLLKESLIKLKNKEYKSDI